MKNHQREFPFVSIGHRILAVIDDPSEVPDTIRDLVEAGVTADAVATLNGEQGVDSLDADGRRRGWLHHAVRSFQRVSVEGDHLRRYAAEIEHGRWVVDVPVGVRLQERVVAILRAHGGHFINAYNAWTIEQVLA